MDIERDSEDKGGLTIFELLLIVLPFVFFAGAVYLAAEKGCKLEASSNAAMKCIDGNGGIAQIDRRSLEFCMSNYGFVKP